MAVALLVPTAGTARAEPLVFHYVSPFLSGIAGNTAISSVFDGGSGIPNDRTVCFSYGLGGNALSQPVPWSVSYFTGLAVPSPAMQYQAGVDAGWYGSSACQITGNAMGFQVHKFSAPQNNTFYGMQLAYQWGSPTWRPWSNSYPPSAKLRLQTYYSVSRRYTNNTIQYGQLFVGLHDIASGENIWYVLSPWDSRGPSYVTNPANEDVHSDGQAGGGTDNYVVNSFFLPGQQYSTIHPNSQNSVGTSGCSCLWYGAYVTKQNLVAAVNRINTRYPAATMSTDPNNYLLTFIGAGTEMHAPTGTSGWIGSRIWEVMALTEY
jgi:hypothetical protein